MKVFHTTLDSLLLMLYIGGSRVVLPDAGTQGVSERRVFCLFPLPKHKIRAYVVR